MSLWNNRKFVPMLLGEVANPFNSNDYIYEMKFDGIRALVFASKKEVVVMSRKKQDITYLYPELQKIKKLIKKDTIFDGEIVAFDKDKPSFSKLQLRSHLKSQNKIKNQVEENPVIFVAFDILYEGKDLINKPLMERKKILDKYQNSDVFFKTFYIESDGVNFFNKIKKNDIEGIVAKKKDSKYLIDERSNYWLKIKNFKQGKFIIGGYRENKGSHTISLILGEKRNGGLYYMGNVVLGKKRALYQKIINTPVLKKSPFVNDVDKKVIYIKPENFCYVKYMERTNGGNLRQPFFYK